MEQFTNLYQVSKTLRFELQPIGKTKENIEKNGILERDNQRAVDYMSVKKVIDEYHKAFIERILNDYERKLDEQQRLIWEESLNEFNRLYHLPTATPNRKVNIAKVQETLRKQISNCFKKDRQYDRLFGMELIREDLAEFVNTPLFEDYILSQKGNENMGKDEVRKIQEDMIQEIAKFKSFTTYFDGYNNNRKNMYAHDDKATSIAHRMIDENLPKFIDNIDVFKKIAASDVAKDFGSLYTNMESYLNVISIDEMFRMDYFYMVLTQRQIDVYNAIIGGKVLDDGTKIQGLNEYVNLYNQQQKDKSKRLPKLKPLFKQILSERNAISWLPEVFESDNEMLKSIEKCYKDLREHVFEGERSLKALLQNISDYNLAHIFITNDLKLTDISQKYFGSWSLVKSAIENDLKSKNPMKKNESEEKYDERIAKILKGTDSFSIAEINRMMQVKVDDFKPIEAYFIQMGTQDNENGQRLNHFARIENAYTDVKKLLDEEYPSGKTLAQDKRNVEKIKRLLDTIKDLQYFVKPLLGSGTESEKDSQFYSEFIPLWEMLDRITPLYNMVRNRLTKKQCTDEKIKVFFENNGKFLSGWTDSQTESDNGTQYGGYLFRRKNSIGEYDYYFGASASTKLFRSFKSVPDSDMSEFERLDYYQLKGETFYGALYKGVYESESANIKRAIDIFISHNGDPVIKETINEERRKRQSKISTAIGYLKFIRQHDSELFKSLLQDDGFEKSNRAMMISIKDTLLSLNRIQSAQKYADKAYTSFSDMMDDVEILLKSKVFSYFPISQHELDDALVRAEKPSYLFKITNKDLSYAETHEKGLRKSRGTDNLHTLYFKALMSGNQSILDIGSGAVFFREKKIDYTDEQMRKGHHHEMLKGKFNYPIISNRRYAFDKFQFHLSILMNYNADKNKDINPMVNAYLKDSNATHIIGIDRGERHLLYLSLIDLKGNIVEQYSLNKIQHTNYHDLLEAKEGKLKEARPSWMEVENIKELKEGYMSLVIHKIAQLMVKYNAIVVLEDLSGGFIRGRQKVEKQVYQKFEKMLIDKLNYLVDKHRDVTELGGVLNACQLASKFEGFEKLHQRKQSGFLFYIPAWNTSKIDPVTGFVNLFDTRYENIAKAKVFLGKFKSIRYNAEKGWFEFAFDYNDFTTKAADTRTQWTLCTYGDRIRTFRNPQKNNQWDDEVIILTDSFRQLFDKYGIDINGNIKEAISAQTDAQFFKDLLGLMRLLLQMRNSRTKSEEDYLLSPVADDSGHFFDSREGISSLPIDADANGAYNIARKGLWMIRKIKETPNNEKPSLAISNKEWLQFAQTKPYLND